MSDLYIPGKDGDINNPRPASEAEYVPESVWQAAAMAVEQSFVGRMTRSQLSVDEASVKSLGLRMKDLCMTVRRACDSDSQFEVLAAVAYRSGDMHGYMLNQVAQIEKGRFVKPNSRDWDARKQAMTKGQVSTEPSRAERRRFEALERKRRKKQEKIKGRIKG